jgi:ABC-type nitrate/sulfonate/bicarbonate transport system substrate-binding protein
LSSEPDGGTVRSAVPSPLGHRLARCGLAAAAVAAVTALAACSSSGSSAAGSPGGGGKGLTTLTVDAAFYGPVDVPLYYAEAKGYFAKQGLNVKFVVASSNTQLASVLGGSVQFASSSPINVVNAATNGAKLVNFMAVEVGYSEDVIMSKQAYDAAGLTANSTAKQKIEALAGKKLGVISATGENAIIFKNLFHYAGIPFSKLNMVQLGTPQAIQAALKNGNIAGANVGSPYPQESVADGYAEYLFHAPLTEIPPMGTAITQTLSTTETYYNANQVTIKKFLTAYEQGLKATFANPTATAKFVAGKYFTDTPLASFMSSFDEDLPIIPRSTSISAAQRDDLKQIAVNAGVDVPSNWDSYFVSR